MATSILTGGGTNHVDLPRAARLRFYLRLNRGGTVHTYDELYRVERLLAEEENKQKPIDRLDADEEQRNG